jgi:phosphate transport system substrate-binding protein
MRYTNTGLCYVCYCLSLVVLARVGKGQSADSLKIVKRVYVSSLGSYNGADELRHELIGSLKKNGFAVAASASQADALLDGRGELWVRGYHALSPRARKNSSYAEPNYDGYLSVKLHGKDDEILWSYFADPRRATFHSLRRDLVDEVVTRLRKEVNEDNSPPTVARKGNDVPASIKGAGATFPSPIYEDWFKSFRNRHPAWSFEYAPVGSEAGIERLSSGDVDFAGTDIPPASLLDRIPANSDSFPTVGGAVVLSYNLPGFASELRLTPDLIASMFLGAVSSWNDAGLKAANPSAHLPDAPIKILHRSDGSGSTFVLTDYLSKVNAEWSRSEGVHSRMQWTVGKGFSGNEGLAEAIAQTPYSFGYVEFIYAFNHHLSFASVRNQAGRFVSPDLLSIMAATNWLGDKQEYFDLSITNSLEVDAYPISTVSWIVLPPNLSAAKKAAAVGFLEWMLTSGQRECSALGYAPLPRNLVDRELSVVRKLR